MHHNKEVIANPLEERVLLDRNRHEEIPWDFFRKLRCHARVVYSVSAEHPLLNGDFNGGLVLHAFFVAWYLVLFDCVLVLVEPSLSLPHLSRTPFALLAPRKLRMQSARAANDSTRIHHSSRGPRVDILQVHMQAHFIIVGTFQVIAPTFVLANEVHASSVKQKRLYWIRQDLVSIPYIVEALRSIGILVRMVFHRELAVQFLQHRAINLFIVLAVVF
mmetsp:Transcript_106064/g.265639  ORF Transcript_106064/g.265639 Transcript_106064/m.265639 type:complete len:218 (+) Transcript_106064:614-1267(+)